jgi:hypothetical protein
MKRPTMNLVSATTVYDSLRYQRQVEDIKVDTTIHLDSTTTGPSTNITIVRSEFFGITVANAVLGSCTIQDCTIGNLKVSMRGQDRPNLELIDCKIKNVEVTSSTTAGTAPDAILKLSGAGTVIDQLTIIGGFREIVIKEGTVKHLKYRTTQIATNKLLVDSAVITNSSFSGTIDDIEIKTTKQSSFLFQNVSGATFLFFKLIDTNIRFDNIDCKQNLSVIEPQGATFHFNKSKAKYIVLNPGTYKALVFESDGDYNLRTTRTENLEEYTSIDTLKINSFQSFEKSNFDFVKTNFNDLELEYFENYGTIQFSNCEIKNSLKIKESNLRKSVFNNITISEKSTVDLIDTNITDTIFTNFRWNNHYKLTEEYNVTKYNSKLNYLISLRESYRQLKSNYLKNGNKIESLEFQKHELRIHFEILQLDRFRTWRNFGNYLVVGSNKLFSDFGQNIWKPLLYLFSCHFVFFNALLFANSKIGITMGLPIDWEATEKGLTLYFQTLLPTHGFEIKNLENLPVPLGGFWDFLIRVCSGYFIFYFITAARKYHQ